LDKRRRRFATRHTHSLRSDRPFPSIVPPSPRTSAYTILSVGLISRRHRRPGGALGEKIGSFRLRLGRVLRPLLSRDNVRANLGRIAPRER
jgi:hypothetical protein